MSYFGAVKAPLALFSLLLVLRAGGLELPDPENPVLTEEWFSQEGTVREGSPSEVRVFEALEAWFAPRADVKKSDFRGLEGEHSFSQRLWFTVAGKKRGELVVVVPTDGANARGLAWAVTWASSALRTPPNVTLIFLFTGAERGRADLGGLGSRTFLQDYYPVVPAAAVYLDVSAQESGTRLVTESGASPSPLWMVQTLSQALGRQELDPRLTGSSPSLFRLDLPGRRTALAPWFGRSIPGIQVAAGPPGTEVVRALESFVESLPSGVPEYWDRHYLTFDLGVRWFWGQGTYLAVFLGVAALLLFGYASLGRPHRGSLRVLLGGAWQLPALLAFGFLALLTSTALGALLQESRGDPEFWRSAPLLVFLFKALVAISLYVVLFLPFRRSPLSRDSDFYEQAALVWLGLSTLGAAAFELSFSFYFLWALVWAAVLVASPWRSLKTLALLAGPLWLVKAAYDVLGPQPDLDLSRWVLASPVAGNFVLAVLFFPFLLQINAWHFAGRRHQDRHEGLRAGLQLAAWSVTAAAVGVALLLAPAPAAVRPPQVITVDPTDPSLSELWTPRVSRSAFLDRTVWNFVFSGHQDPESVELELVSNQPLLVFDSSFPVVLDPDGLRARIVVGRQPSLPLSLRVTLPQDTRAQLVARVEIQGTEVYRFTHTLELAP